MTAIQIVSRKYDIIALLLLIFILESSMANISSIDSSCTTLSKAEIITRRRVKNGAIDPEGRLYTPTTVKSFMETPTVCIHKTHGCLPLCCFVNRCNQTFDFNNKAAEPKQAQSIFKVNAQITWQFYLNLCPSDDIYYSEPFNNNFNKDDDGLFLLANGSLYNGRKSLTKKSSDYCVDMSFDGSSTAIVCFEIWNTALIIETIRKIIICSYIISTIALLITFFIYLLLPELLTLHGKILFCHASSLMCTYLCFLWRVFEGYMKIEHNKHVCFIRGEYLKL